jgi:hypothetical protein
VRVALLLPDPSEFGVRVRELAGELGQRCELSLFASGPERLGDREVRPLGEVKPRALDRLLVPIDDDPACAVLVPCLRRFGGTVWLASWGLGRLARAVHPALEGGGWAGRLAAWREGGFAALRGGPSPLNRSVVRFGDAFLVADEALRDQIVEERNAHTPVRRWEHDDPVEHLANMLEAMPAHRTGRRSLIAAAVAASDEARRSRREMAD